MVVAGKMDAHLDGFGKIWDLAPFKVMIEEGRKITRLDGYRGLSKALVQLFQMDYFMMSSAIVNKRK